MHRDLHSNKLIYIAVWWDKQSLAGGILFELNEGWTPELKRPDDLISDLELKCIEEASHIVKELHFESDAAMVQNAERLC